MDWFEKEAGEARAFVEGDLKKEVRIAGLTGKKWVFVLGGIGAVALVAVLANL